MLYSSDLPTHPRTGRQAVGIVNGKPVWPILGGSGEGDDGGDGGAGDGGQGGNGGQGDGAPSYTPPASQADLDRIVQDRLARLSKSYGMTPEEAKTFKTRVGVLENDLSSESDKIAKKAADDARAEERTKGTTRAVRAEFRAAAKGTLTDAQRDALLEDLDLSRYADEDGEPDVDKIEKKIKAFAPAQGKTPAPPRPLGQGNRPPVETSARERGKAEAQRRFSAATST